MIIAIIILVIMIMIIMLGFLEVSCKAFSF